MTNIFSSKANAALTEAKAENEKLKATVIDLTQKVEQSKQVSEHYASFKAEVAKIKTDFEASIETMKTEFSTVINSLKEEIKTLTEAKAKVEAEVKAAKEIKKEEVQEKVSEQLAAKIATMGLTEDKLPPISTTEPLASIRIVRHGSNGEQ